MVDKINKVEEYLNELPDDRKESLSTVREVIIQNLPTGYDEVINWGMITYEVPLVKFPETYNGKPLMYAAIASQKNHMSVYLMGCYISPDIRKAFENAYKKSGKRFDAGKSCIRFKYVEDLSLKLIGKTIGSMSVDKFIENYLLSRK